MVADIEGHIVESKGDGCQGISDKEHARAESRPHSTKKSPMVHALGLWAALAVLVAASAAGATAQDNFQEIARSLDEAKAAFALQDYPLAVKKLAAIRGLDSGNKGASELEKAISGKLREDLDLALGMKAWDEAEAKLSTLKDLFPKAEATLSAQSSYDEKIQAEVTYKGQSTPAAKPSGRTGAARRTS